MSMYFLEFFFILKKKNAYLGLKIRLLWRECNTLIVMIIWIRHHTSLKIHISQHNNHLYLCVKVENLRLLLYSGKRGIRYGY